MFDNAYGDGDLEFVSSQGNGGDIDWRNGYGDGPIGAHGGGYSEGPNGASYYSTDCERPVAMFNPRPNELLACAAYTILLGGST